MKDAHKTKEQLIGELTEMRRRVAELERSDAERTEREEALRESEERYRTLVQLSPAGIVIHVNGRIELANPSLASMLGARSPEELKGRSVFDFVPSDYRDFVRKRVRRIIAGRQQAPLTEQKFVRLDGSLIDVEVTGFVFTHQGRDAAMVVVDDITQRKRAQEALRESKARLDLALQSASMGVWHWDILEDRRYFDDQVCHLLGIEPAAFTGVADEFLGVVHPDDREPLRAALARTIEEGVLYRPEYRAVWPDGSVHYIAARGRLVRNDANGRPERISGIIWDITERKQAEEALRESEQKFRLLFEKSADPILLLDGETFVDFNEAAFGLMGCSSKEQCIGLHPWDISPERQPDGRLSSEKGKELTDETMRRGTNRFEWVRRTFDGEEFWVEVSHTVIPIQGRLLKYTMWRDIRERKQAEAQLRESEERYRAAIESSNDGVTLFRGPSLLYSNRRFLDMFGYDSLEEARHTDRFLRIHPDDREMVVEYTARRQRGEPAPSPYECKGIAKNGKIMHLEISVAGVTYLGEPTFLAYLRDITERKRAEEALLQSEKKYRSIFDNAPEGIFQTTPDGRYLTVNPALARMYGYASPEEMMQAVTDLQGQQYVVPEDRVRLKALYRQQGFVKGFETHIYTKSRDKVWISMNAQAVTDPEGNLLYYEGTAENITERKNLEEQLRQAQKMEAVGTLAGGVAHDFNNILTVIMGLANLIQLSIDKDDLLRPYVDQIVASSERAADLTQGLLAFSRKQRIALEPHKVNGVVASTAKLLRRLLPEDIGLAMSLADEGAISLLDITQINQVLMNLATNAWDAMPHGGSLTIKTERVALDENFRKAHGFGRPGEYVRLSISDTGTGMDERTMERIFEPFFTTKEVGKGTGLGLASAYGIVKRLKGYIAVSSVPFKGTTFDIYLPLINPPPQEEAPAVEEIRRGTETILIVEDDGDVRSMLPEILRTKGYATIEAVDGDGAIKVHREHKEKIDLIILDVVMPGKNGKEALDEIIRADPGVKAIFLSGYTGDIVIDKGIEKEGVDFLQKPLSATALLSKVREVLDR